MSEHKEWLEHPITEQFLKALEEKARGIRYEWFLYGNPTKEDKVYVRLLDDIRRSLQDGPVEIPSAEEVAKDLKEFDI